MDIFQAIIIGIVEGFTEFLPISSTGHMIVVSHFLGVEQSDIVKAYEVIIQFSAILAVLFLYKDRLDVKSIPLWRNVIIASTPILAIGYIFKDFIKSIFSIEIVAVMFIVGGIIFLVVEYLYSDRKVKVEDVDSLSVREALIIGFGQIFSLIPGTSRAGSTIIAGMLSGVSRKASTEFSFLLAIPVMLAVSGYDLLKHYEQFLNVDLTPFIVGFIVSFVVAYLTIKLLIAFLQRFTFVAFGIYRVLFGTLLLILF